MHEVYLLFQKLDSRRTGAFSSFHDEQSPKVIKFGESVLRSCVYRKNAY